VMPPTPNDIWGSVYTTELIAQLRALEEEALREVEKRGGGGERTDNLHARRIRLLADDLIGALEHERKTYQERSDVKREEAYRAASKAKNLFADVASEEYHFVRDAKEKEGPAKVDVCPSVALKGKTRYRLSAYVKFKDVAPQGKMGGLWVAFWDTNNSKYFCANKPVGGMKGSSDWMAVSNEFTTLENPDMGKLWLWLRDATGEAWIRGLRLEEVK